jgi:flagellar motor switch/type III secretory pathway protein FliN
MTSALRQARKSNACQRVTAADLRTAESCVLTNRLYGQRGLQHGELTFYWQTAQHAEVREWITLTAQDARLQIGLHGDATGMAARSLDWRSYADETRLLAWTACHEPLLELFSAVFQRDWVPEAISSAPSVSAGVRAQFSVHRADGSLLITGTADFAAHWIPGLTVTPESSCPRLCPTLSKVRAPLPIILDQLDITPDELTQFERGCIVRLDNRLLMTAQPRLTVRIGRISWLVELNGVRATVIGFADNNSGGLNVNEAVEVATLPVRLTFTAGRLVLPFGTLSEVGPGFVFELDKRLDDQVITVNANETPIAVGELVAIGDLLGVRITRMLLKA